MGGCIYCGCGTHTYSNNQKDVQPSTYLSRSLFRELRHLSGAGKADVCILSARLCVFDNPSPQTLRGLIFLSIFYTQQHLDRYPCTS